MNVGIVIVTHGRTGESLLEEAGFVLGEIPEGILAVSFNSSEDLKSSLLQIRSSIDRSDSGAGVLVLTDLMGASPSNQVAGLLEGYHGVMVTGVNLSMLICACNYRGKSLELVVQKTVACGKRSVKIFQP